MRAMPGALKEKSPTQKRRAFFETKLNYNKKLIEINVLSPGGITRINKFNKTKLQKNILSFVELIHHKKEDAINKKLTFRKLIEDA